jgi:predicted ester cyclase
MSKDVFQAHIEQIWNNKDASGIERFIAPNYRGFDAEELISGADGYKKHYETLSTAFPDLRITVEIILEEDDRAAARLSIDATHQGEFLGIPPTGVPVHLTVEAIVRVENGQIVEEHANSDALGLLRQLGVFPQPPRVPALIF